MKVLGLLLVLVGAATFVADKLKLPADMVAKIQNWQPWAGIVVAAVGLLLVVAAPKKKPAKA
jgi:hypothetical protein